MWCLMIGRKEKPVKLDASKAARKESVTAMSLIPGKEMGGAKGPVLSNFSKPFRSSREAVPWRKVSP